MTTRLPLSHCPKCNSKLDAATTIDDEQVTPEPGDATICFTCYEVLRFADDLTIEAANIKDFDPETRDMLVAAIVMLQTHRILN